METGNPEPKPFVVDESTVDIPKGVEAPRNKLTK